MLNHLQDWRCAIVLKGIMREAIINLNLSLKIQNSKEKILLLGNICKENGNFEKAQIYFEDIVNSYTDNFEGKLALANLEIDKGNI
jgi:hypothetical protein